MFIEETSGLSLSKSEEKIQVVGDKNLIVYISRFLEEALECKKSLYVAQEELKLDLINQRGIYWYNKSAEAIQFLVKEAYNNI